MVAIQYSRCKIEEKFCIECWKVMVRVVVKYFRLFAHWVHFYLERRAKKVLQVVRQKMGQAKFSSENIK